MKPFYIFASSRTWNRGYFNQISSDVNANWQYVSDNFELEDALLTREPRYIFFLHWNWIVPESICKAHECVCFHMTDVPYGRGGSPLQNLIIAGHSKTMLTALRMVKEMDAGPVYMKKSLSLDGSAEEVYIRSGKLSLEIIHWMILNDPKPTPQEGEIIAFKRRVPAQSILPHEGNLVNAYDFIRMLDAEGYPNAFLEHGNYKIKFKNAKLGVDGVTAEVEIKMIN